MDAEHDDRAAGTRSGRPTARPAAVRLLAGFAVLAVVLGFGSLGPGSSVAAPVEPSPPTSEHDHEHEHEHEAGGEHLHEEEMTLEDLFERRVLAAAAPALPEATPTPVAAAAAGPVCTGTGADGPRVQAVLAHRGPVPDPAVLQTIATAMAGVDRTFVDSAARTGGYRAVRWVTTPGPTCQAVVLTVQISDVAAADVLSSGGLFDELVTKGLSDPTRKYLVWTEGEITTPRTGTCGLGESWNDDSPGPGNANANPGGAFGPTFATIDPRCWADNGGYSVPAHELMHMLGAVQRSAPNSDGAGHCTDDFDAMCYGPATRVVPGCATVAQERLLDCNNDDYFHTDPAAGSYLCDAWNTARNPYLVGAADLAPLRRPGAVAAWGLSGRVDVVWTRSPSCAGPDSYVVGLDGGPSVVVGAGTDRVSLPAGPGTYTVRVTPVRAGVAGVAATTIASVPSPNRAPVGQNVLFGTDRRRLALFGYALDPDTDAPARTIVVIEGVGFFAVTADVAWDEVPRRHPGYGPRHGYLFGADLPPGSRDVCVVAEDTAGGPSTGLGCFRVTVK
jgi:hypothetical protein